MPGIRFLDARGGPVLHDAVLPFEPGGVALSVLEPGYRGIHGFVVHAGGEHGPVVVFPDGCELVEGIAVDEHGPEQLVETELLPRLAQQPVGELRKVNAPVRRVPLSAQLAQEILLARGGAAQVNDGHARLAGPEAGVVVDARDLYGSGLRIDVDEVVVAVAVHLPGKDIGPFHFGQFAHQVGAHGVEFPVGAQDAAGFGEIEFLAVRHPADGLASGDIEEGLAGGGLHEQAELPVMAADA